MNRFLFKTGLFATFLLFVTFSLKSCRKEKPTIAEITVIDSSSTVLEGIRVILFPTKSLNSDGSPAVPNGQIDLDIIDTVYTNIDGKAIFDYTERFNLGQAGFTVLDIEVLLLKSDGNDSLYGEGILKIKPEETNKETVIAFPV